MGKRLILALTVLLALVAMTAMSSAGPGPIVPQEVRTSGPGPLKR